MIAWESLRAEIPVDIAASNSLAEAQRLTAAHENASARLVDMDNREDVAQLVASADVVVR